MAHAAAGPAAAGEIVARRQDMDGRAAALSRGRGRPRPVPHRHARDQRLTRRGPRARIPSWTRMRGSAAMSENSLLKLFGLSGRVALVTGSSQGIGLALARALASS